MEYYKNIDFTPKPLYDLNVLNKTASSIEQGHKEAVTAKSALNTFIGSLDLNELEDPYKVELKNRVQKTIDDNLVYGSDFVTGTDLTALQGELASDNELLGKLKLNKDYQAWKKSIMDNKEIDQDTKDYLLQNPDNQYNWDKFSHYNTDENGNKIFKNITPFKAGEEATKHYGLGEIAAAAVKLVKPNSFSSTNYDYIEPDETHPYGQLIDSDTGATESITQERLMDAMLGLIHSDSEYMASVAQEMRVQEYTANRDGYSNNFTERPDLYNTDGSTKTMDEYIFDKMNPLAQAGSYIKTQNVKKPYTQRGSVYNGGNNGNGGSPVVGRVSEGIMPTTDATRSTQVINPGAAIVVNEIEQRQIENDIITNSGLTS